MEDKDVAARVERLLGEGNYLSACMHLKDTALDQTANRDLTGLVAMKLVDTLAAERNKERAALLRALLMWTLRDVPGLAPLYREQLRMAAGRQAPFGDILKGVKTASEVASGEKSAAEAVEETVDDISRKIGETAEDLRSGAFGERVQDFLSGAGIDVEDGLKKAADFFSLLGNAGSTTAKTSERPSGDAEDRSSKG